MEKTASRFVYFINKPPLKYGNQVLNGSVITYIKVDGENIRTILNFKNGKLQSQWGSPAVQCSDGHIEEWDEGLISNLKVDNFNQPYPAIITQGGRLKEYWIQGKMINKEIHDSEEQ